MALIKHYNDLAYFVYLIVLGRGSNVPNSSSYLINFDIHVDL